MEEQDRLDEERVKPCLECGTVLPFDAESCSLCGTRIAAESGGEEAVKPCMACEALIPEDDIFCPDCGDFALHVVREAGVQHAPALGSREGRMVAILARALSILIATSALGITVAVVVEAWRLRMLASGSG